jgi:hypothetical protein
MAGNQMHVQTLSVILMTLAVILITLGSMLVRGETPGGIQVGGVLAYEPRFSTIHREFGPESWLAAPGIGAADQDGLSPPDCSQLARLVDTPDRLLAASEHRHASWRLLPCAMRALTLLGRPANTTGFARIRPIDDLWTRLDLTTVRTSFWPMIGPYASNVPLERAVYLRMALSEHPAAVEALRTQYRAEIQSPGEWITSFEAVAAADWDGDGREDLLVLVYDRELPGNRRRSPEPYFEVRLQIVTAANAESRMIGMDYVDWLIARRDDVKSVLAR